MPPARGRGRLALICLAACGLAAGCADIRPQVAYPQVGPKDAPRDPELAARAAAETGGAWNTTLAGLRAQDQRVADVAYRIVTANAALCTDQAPQSGLVLQSALQYSVRLRPAAEAYFRLDDRPAVEALAADGPAQMAGMKLGDVILAVNGEALPTPAPTPGGGADDRPPTYGPVQRALTRINLALANGPARIVVQRGSAKVRLVVAPRTGCAYDAQVVPGAALNASADGKHVFISAALVNYAKSDDMLALVLGHEFAHDLLHHHDRLDRKGLARNVLGEFGSTPASLMIAEKEADYVGLYLTARAGYDISDAPGFWLRFPSGGAELSWSHPNAAERAASLAATRDEIARKLRDGEPLIPTPAPDGAQE